LTESDFSGGDYAPYFFLSYAHTPRHDPTDPDPDEDVVKFYNELCKYILNFGTLPAGRRVGFMDHDLRPGNVWPWSLSRALATCHVYVPLYSQRFFTSAECGKEWWAFSKRIVAQAAREDRPVEAIVPVIWTPVDASSLPEAARMIHFNHRELGHLYATEGLFTLSQLNGDATYNSAYRKAVLGLAKRIVDVAQRRQVEASHPRDYATLENAFKSALTSDPGERRLRITVVAPSSNDLPPGRGGSSYGRSPLDWNPYHPDCRRPLADHASDLARNLGYQAVVSDLSGRDATVSDEDRPREPEILLIDPWATVQPECRQALARFNSTDRPWIQLIIPMNAKDEETANARVTLRDSIEGLLGVKLASGTTTGRTLRSVPSLDDFSEALPRVVSEVARHYLKHAEPHPPEGTPVRRPQVLRPPPPPATPTVHQDPPEQQNPEVTND
jgi:FxsC-like protein